MKSKYVTDKQFDKLSNGKNIKSYPNPYVKDVNGIQYNIVPSSEKFEVRILSEQEKLWWCASETEEEVVLLSISEIGWFPTELVAGTLSKNLGRGVTRENFDMNTELSKKTGWLKNTGSLGSRGNLFLKSKVNEAINILNKNGFSFKKIEF